MSDKTKAAPHGRQCLTTKQDQHTRPYAGGQSLTAPGMTGAQLFKSCANPTISKLAGCLPNIVVLVEVTNNRVANSQLTAPLAHPPISPVLGKTQRRDYAYRYPIIGYHPFGSIPRCCSSLRTMRFIHAASDSSPSCCCALSIMSRSSGSSLNWKGGLPRLSFLCVDTLITPDVMCLCVMTHYIHRMKKATPRSAGTLPRRLTKPLSEVTAMANQEHTQTRPEFTWLFLATPRHHPECSPIVLRFDADTEDAARDAFPGWNLVFAAKIRAHAPCRVAFFDYTTRRGWEFDSAAFQEVRHV